MSNGFKADLYSAGVYFLECKYHGQFHNHVCHAWNYSHAWILSYFALFAEVFCLFCCKGHVKNKGENVLIRVRQIWVQSKPPYQYLYLNHVLSMTDKLYLFWEPLLCTYFMLTLECYPNLWWVVEGNIIKALANKNRF